ncbi:MAG: type II toxin-antitoxin system RelE/ParE family toxin [Bacteroides sp.]|nr:type II toxin-antitoxin system RelE/ParE family toxin [Bacillota bacterium]MCM1393629.1 type II toxin-antitoxin system RelE/ParE family toxin [[Eubacterium] siraeum]MCM1454975.1 type II toxin-antitoxin system RelE/ParE family toxin [Bacteroides sp.]
MYDIEFYQTSNGKIPAIEYLKELDRTGCRKEKDKIETYINMLANIGDKLLINKNVAKHLENGIYELRPGRYRVLYAKLNPDKYVILHIHLKRDKKEQNNEIKKAYKEYKKIVT